MVELAVRVAECEAAKEVGRLYWRRAVDSLRWVLGHEIAAPVSALLVGVDLDEPRCSTVMSEAERAYHGMRGARPYVQLGLRYLTGVENACTWVVTGDGLPVPIEKVAGAVGLSRGGRVSTASHDPAQKPPAFGTVTPKGMIQRDRLRPCSADLDELR